MRMEVELCMNEMLNVLIAYNNLIINNMGLDFSYTCPKIDKEIGKVKDTIIDCISDYITQLCPLMPESEILKLSKDWGEDIYNNIESAFETIRETNEDMRKQADYQIYKLEGEVSDLKSEIKELERTI